MGDSPASPETGHDAGVATERVSTTGTPRWVKVLGTFAVALFLLAGVMLLAGGGPGGHGPGRHTGAGDADGGGPPSEDQRPAPNASEGHRPPPGVPEHGPQRQ